MPTKKHSIAANVFAALVAAVCLSSAFAAQLSPSSRPGVGAIPYFVSSSNKGVTFRTWAPNAQAVSVAGSFNFYSNTAHMLGSEGNGWWSGDVPNVVANAQYKFAVKYNNVYTQKNDPRARRLTNSVGNSVVYDPNSYTWVNNNFQIDNWNELIIYEMHIGAFWVPDGSAPGTFIDAIAKLDHIQSLGVNCVELLPINEFPGDLSWGYNLSYPFSVESIYGNPNDLKKFVDECHARGIAVLNDVVYNHLGPNDLDMWKFDGWNANNLGGIFFYNDTTHATTPWGNTRMDYSRGEVRQYIRDNAMMWLDEFRMDGLRWDGTKYIRRTDQFGIDIPEGWSLLQWCNNEIDAAYPGKLSIAEDFDDNDWVTKPTGAGGAGFDTQWDWFVHSIRSVVEETSDANRSMASVRDIILQNYNGVHTQRIIYTESHDEDANGKSRVPSEISPAAPGNWYARKRSTLAAAVAFFSPGIPMMFMGQEFLEDGYFDPNDPLDWSKTTTYAGILQLYKDMIALRRNLNGETRGLTGASTNVFHVNDWNKVIAWHRWENGGGGDDVVVLANFSTWPLTNYRIGLPRPGMWRCRMNSDWNGYSSDYANTLCVDIEADGGPYDGMPYSGNFNAGAYSFIVYSQDGASQGNPSDLNGDCVVDSGDLGLLLLDFGPCPGCASDLDGSGEVDGGDVGVLLLDYDWTCS
ncbi:MAG: alpha amylase C-terminal domain-containing protein [Planctomycetes bacterium]|nr:alpha amylase C-terminal domain-containing protein [Planctomycetota bacterium]